jgi:tetratricopeptide (TPR) repeat protein
MGLFNFFKKDKKSKYTIEALDAYIELEDRNEKLKKENREWEKDFSHLSSLRQKAKILEDENNYMEAVELYLESIEFGEKSNKLNIENYGYDIKRVIILYGKLKQKAYQRQFLERMISTYPDCREAIDWDARLAKITPNDSPKENTEFNVSDINKPIAQNPTLGTKIQAFKNALPEFNFYYDMPEEMHTAAYLAERNPVPFERMSELRELRQAFTEVIEKAKVAEKRNDVKSAIEAYEKMLVEEYEGREPYERLMILYRKLKWKDEEIRIIKHSINFFENLRESQLNKTLALSKKYGKEDFANDYIAQGMRIQYFGGAFDLYNPFPVIAKWKTRLEKLN